MKKRRGYTPEQTLVRRDRAKRMGLCSNCYVNPRKKGKTRCVKCLGTADRRYGRLKGDPAWRRENSKRAHLWQKKNKSRRNAWTRESRRKIKMMVLEHYGVKCNCPGGCDVTEPKFLTIDHIHGGGVKHRKSIGRQGGDFYAWLVKNKYPDGFQVLCFNCNCAKGFFGKCPHEEVQKI